MKDYQALVTTNQVPIMTNLSSFIRKIKLIQPMVITLKEGGGRGGEGGGVKRVMVSFFKFKLSECKKQIYANI